MGVGRVGVACVVAGALLSAMGIAASTPSARQSDPMRADHARSTPEASPAPPPPSRERDGGSDPGQAGDDAGTGDAPRWRDDAVFGPREDAHREALMREPVARVRKGTGGRSLAFKITLEDGTEGYFKPHQRFSGSNWHAEVASYYLDRALGLGRVPPVVGRRLSWAPLRRAAGGDERVAEVHVEDDGTVRGAFIWWIPEPLVPLAPGAHWERWIRVTGAIDVSPLVAARNWRRALEVGHGQHEGTLQEPDRPERPAELSDMILFDYLTHNLDRWGGRFTNVRTRGRGGPLIYLDNAAGFFPGRHRIGLMDARLHVVQRFRRRTVEAIRHLDVHQVAARMAEDPLAPVLDAHYLEGLELRRQHLLEHVEAMVRRFGDDALPW